MTPDRHNRRKFLAATAGGAIALAASDPASADHGDGCGDCGTDKQTDGGWDPAAGGRTCSLKCDEYPPDFYDGQRWFESSITFHNCSDCPRHIEIGVSDVISSSKEQPHEMAEHSHQSYHLSAGERKTFWFTGSVIDLHIPYCDVNVAISQRSGHRSKHDECK